MKKLIVLFLLTAIPLFFVVGVRADDIESQLNDITQALNNLKRAAETNEANLKNLNQQLEGIKTRVAAVEKEIVDKEKEVKKGDEVLVYQKNLLNERARSYYINSGKTPFSLLALLISENLTVSLQNFFYQKSVADEDKKTIIKIVLYIKNLEEKKKSLEQEKQQLAALKANIDSQAAKAKKYQTELQNQIAQLTAKQQQLLAQKLSSLNLPTSLGAGPLYCTDDRNLDPGFRPAFAFFTFGIPHRVGMNQYGALGRAKEGQDFRTILNSYFNNVRIECRSTPSRNIKVQGYGEMKLEDYLKGIYEMPESWPIEALKAQVVAARSYAIAYTKNGENEICTTQACQVYKGGNKGGAWEEAVRQTGEQACSDGQGLVIVSNDTGEIATAWYASTAGGYTFLSSDVGWSARPWTKRLRDTNGDISSFNDLFSKAYDRESPCFYAAQGWRNEYNKSAWLKSDEVADIVNVVLLAKKDPSTQTHLSQVDKPNPDGVETWSMERVKQELRSRGVTPFNSINSVSVNADFGLGKTNSITFSGDAGTESFDGGEFKTFFNLRAPANIQIVGGLYNVEKK